MVDIEIARNAFLNTELEAGLMFCRLALRTKDPAKRERNRINAQKAYKAVLRFSKNAALGPSQAQALQKGIADLKRLMGRLAKPKLKEETPEPPARSEPPPAIRTKRDLRQKAKELIQESRDLRSSSGELLARGRGAQSPLRSRSKLRRKR